MKHGAKPEALIAAALRCESARWPTDALPNFESDFFDAATDHGVAELLSVVPALETWPHNIQTAILQRRREAAAVEIVHQRELAAVLAALDGRNIKALILKGAGVAHTHYRAPWMRPRLDTDLLIAAADRLRAVAVLESRGYEPATHFAGEFVTYQSQFRRVDHCEFTHRVDLHWKIANPQIFADAFAFDELHRNAVSIPQLGSSARTLSSSHALALACLHRVAHHGNTDRLIWLYDIRLLVDAMSHSELHQAARIAAEKGLLTIVAAGVARSVELVGSSTRRGELDAFVNVTSKDNRATTEFLRPGRTKFDDLRSDMKALDGWRPKLRLIREHLFPPAAYVRKTYGFSNPALLPFAYAIRAVSGASKWFRPGG